MARARVVNQSGHETGHLSLSLPMVKVHVAIHSTIHVHDLLLKKAEGFLTIFAVSTFILCRILVTLVVELIKTCF